MIAGLPNARRWSWRLLVIEALACLALASVLLRLLPFRRLAPWLGPVSPAGAPSPHCEPDDAQRKQALRVGAAVRRAARLLPWPVLCLPEAMAAKAMLARRGLRATLHLGAHPGGGVAAEAGLHAHAWLLLGSVEVTGGAERRAFVELARFG
ncbi:MAG: lasso peptide biosynthesis B2 protein [Bacteroidales bacterium]